MAWFSVRLPALKASVSRLLKGLTLFVEVLGVAVVTATVVTFWKDRNGGVLVPTPQSCNVAKVSILGEVVTYEPGAKREDEKSLFSKNEDRTSSEDVVRNINAAVANDDIRAIIVEIDSWGGSPVGGEEIQAALVRVSKPTIAVIREVGASAAYLAATGAKVILASALSDVGSIGVTMSYLDNSTKNAREGLTFNQLSIGKFKDSGNPDKTLTSDERALFMRDLSLLHEHFVALVARNRNLTAETVRELADGSSMLGEAAREHGLIDSIGGLEEAKDWLRDRIGIEPRVCDSDS